MRAPASAPLHPEAQRSLLQRRLDLLERLVTLRPPISAYAETAAHARRQLRQVGAGPAGARERQERYVTQHAAKRAISSR